jgi:mono/diheme cytochrome c family protein
VVVAFLGVECPLARLYAVRLEELWQEFRPRGVQVVGVNANEQDSAEEWQAFGAEFELSYPLLKDLGAKVAEQLEATRTPEVVVLDQAGGIRYRGRIDDQYGVGYQRPAATRADLKVALEELLAGQEVSVPETEAAGCFIGRRRTVEASPSDAEPVQPVTPITWSGEVAAIVQRRCQSCHRPGEIAPFSLLEYSEAASWSETIGESVREGRMPPWHANPAYGEFANDARLSDQERTTLLNWVEQGAPEGEPDQAPPPRTFSDGWQIQQPDLVIAAGDGPETIPAEGTIEYRYVVADPGFTEDRWIQAAEARPGNRRVVHHINVFVLRPEWADEVLQTELSDFWLLQTQMLCGYVPGNQGAVFAEGSAKRIPAGSKIVFQIHYTATGKEEQDQSYLGLVFAPRDEVDQVIETVPAMMSSFEIPPGATQQVEMSYPIKTDTEVIAFLPHMHLRGKSFRYTAKYPDGKEEILLDVPRYDFGWQRRYELREAKRLPAGSKVECVAVFDNTAENPANPDPKATVHWGEQSWDEMMIGYFDVVRQDEPAGRLASNKQRRMGIATAIVSVALAGVVWLVIPRRIRTNGS